MPTQSSLGNKWAPAHQEAADYVGTRIHASATSTDLPSPSWTGHFLQVKQGTFLVLGHSTGCRGVTLAHV